MRRLRGDYLAMSIKLQGSMVAIATPMKYNNVDYLAFANLIEFHIQNGSDAIVAAGTTGESATLNMDEHREVIQFVVKKVNNRLPVIAGTGANSTSEAIELTVGAKHAGADACLLVTPYYNKPTQEGLYQHHRYIAGAVDIPQILYNVPGRTACDMLPATVQRLSEIDNIIGIKETVSLERMQEIRDLCDATFAIYSGEDALAAEAILQGAAGVISVTANVAPALMHRLCDAALNDDRKQAEDIDQLLQPLHKALFLESNPIPVKWALAQMGLILIDIRLPLTNLSKPHYKAVADAMKHAGIKCI